MPNGSLVGSPRGNLGAGRAVGDDASEKGDLRKGEASCGSFNPGRRSGFKPSDSEAAVAGVPIMKHIHHLQKRNLYCN